MFFPWLYPEELNHLVHLPTTSHKIERRGMAKNGSQIGVEWVCEKKWLVLLTASCRLMPD